MCLHASTFVKDVQCNLIESLGTPVFELITCLKLIWRTWRFSISHGAEFRACSFRLIALLGPVIDCLDIRRKPLQICFIHLYQFPELCKNAFNGVKYLAAAFNTLWLTAMTQQQTLSTSSSIIFSSSSHRTGGTLPSSSLYFSKSSSKNLSAPLMFKISAIVAWIAM